eukprot:2792468-Rhodomonas_salina.1
MRLPWQDHTGAAARCRCELLLARNRTPKCTAQVPVPDSDAINNPRLTTRHRNTARTDFKFRRGE